MAEREAKMMMAEEVRTHAEAPRRWKHAGVEWQRRRKRGEAKAAKTAIGW